MVNFESISIQITATSHQKVSETVNHYHKDPSTYLSYFCVVLTNGIHIGCSGGISS